MNAVVDSNVTHLPTALNAAHNILIVSLNISTWTRSRRDRKATKTIEDAHEVSHGKARATKTLCSSSKEINDLEKYIADTRGWHRQQTLYWDEYGRRALPKGNYFQYLAELSTRKANVESMIQAAVATYDSAVDADRLPRPVGLGELFNAADYPSRSALVDQYGIKVAFEPVPTGGQFMFSIGKEEEAVLKAHVDELINSRVAQAEDELVGRVSETVTRVVDTLTKSLDEEMIDGKSQDRWHGTTISNVRELAELLPRLNITNNPKINQIAADLQSKIGKYTPEQVKASVGVKQQVVEDAQDILNGLKGLI